jgi:hypothetical protein
MRGGPRAGAAAHAPGSSRHHNASVGRPAVRSAGRTTACRGRSRSGEAPEVTTARSAPRRARPSGRSDSCAQPCPESPFSRARGDPNVCGSRCVRDSEQQPAGSEPTAITVPSSAGVCRLPGHTDSLGGPSQVTRGNARAEDSPAPPNGGDDRPTFRGGLERRAHGLPGVEVAFREDWRSSSRSGQLLPVGAGVEDSGRTSPHGRHPVRSSSGHARGLAASPSRPLCPAPGVSQPRFSRR